MSTTAKPVPTMNRLLASLPDAELERLETAFRPIELEHRQVLYRYLQPIDHLYFPTRGVISSVRTMNDGTTIEVGTIGHDGAAGLCLLWPPQLSLNEVFVQVPGEALRISAEVIEREATPDSVLRRLLLSYQMIFIHQVSQSVACNNSHSVLQRCCR